MKTTQPTSFAHRVSDLLERPAAEPLLRRALLLDESAVVAGLRELACVRARPVAGPVGEAAARGLPARLPTSWQVALGIARMQHRLLARRASVGLASARRRPGLLPRVLEHHLVRAPLLLLDGSVVPGDLSGLRSSSTTIQRHLLGTYHARGEANYDLEILAARDPDAIVALREACAAIVAGTHPNARRWRALCVYEGAHEELLAQIERALRGGFAGLDVDDPDVSFFAFLRFCARQPTDAPATVAAWRAGQFTIPTGWMPT
jgi:hypothetical protein